MDAPIPNRLRGYVDSSVNYLVLVMGTLDFRERFSELVNAQVSAQISADRGTDMCVMDVKTGEIVNEYFARPKHVETIDD